MKTYINKTIAFILSIVLLCSVTISAQAKNDVENITLGKTMQYTFDWANDDFQHWYKFVPSRTATYTAKISTTDERVRNDSGAISLEIWDDSENAIVSGLWSDLSLSATAKAKLTKGKTYYIYIEFWQNQQIPISTVLNINIPATKITKLTSGNKQFKVKWKKVAIADGYKIQYSTDKKFKKGVKTVSAIGTKTTSYTIKKLKKNKKYYVRIRAYKITGNTSPYSSWSKVKTVKTKK